MRSRHSRRTPWRIDVEGSDLQVTVHPAERPRALLLLVHGYAEHSGRYRKQVEFLTSRGIVTATYDLRGHGISPGRCGRVTVSRHVVDNLRVRDSLVNEFSDATTHEGLPLPSLLMGHSMGSLIAAESAVRRPWNIDGLVLSSPSLVVGEQTPGIVVALAPLISRVLPFLPVESLDAEDISSIPEEVAAYVQDPLVHTGPVPAAAGGSMVKDGRRMLHRCRSLQMPVLLVNGDEDRLATVSGARRFATEAGSLHDPRPEITYREFAGGRHELFNDRCADELYATLDEWLDARLGA